MRGAHVHDPAKAKAVAGNITFSPFMGSRGLVPLRGVGQRSTNPWRKQEAGDGAALAALHPASAVLRVFTPTLLPVAVRATITPFTQATQNAVRAELTTAFHSAPTPGKALPLSVISTAFSRVGGLVSWTLTQPRAATQPAAGVLPVLGELTLGAANG